MMLNESTANLLFSASLTYEEICWILFANQKAEYTSPHINCNKDYENLLRVREQVRTKLENLIADLKD
jgi:hypothetical protein